MFLGDNLPKFYAAYSIATYMHAHTHTGAAAMCVHACACMHHKVTVTDMLILVGCMHFRVTGVAVVILIKSIQSSDCL